MQERGDTHNNDDPSGCWDLPYADRTYYVDLTGRWD